jgi:hypothetical protein
LGKIAEDDAVACGYGCSQCSPIGEVSQLAYNKPLLFKWRGLGRIVSIKVEDAPLFFWGKTSQKEKRDVFTDSPSSI